MARNIKGILFTVLGIFLGYYMMVSSVHAVNPTPGAGTSISLSEIFACQDDTHPEWVEFYNNGTTDVNLSQWKIERKSTADWNTVKTLTSVGIIQAGSYVKFDLSNYLNDSGFFLRLKDDTDSIIETFPDGDAQKCPSSSLLTSWIKEGQSWVLTTTPTASASNILTAVPTPTPSPSASPTPTPTPSPTPSPTPTPSPSATPGAQPTSISLSEIYACQADGTKEWVELANSASASVTITNWKLTDDDNNEQPITSLTIPAKGFAVVEISKYARGMLTNDGDVVTLYDAVGKKVDSYEYSECASDQTWAKMAGVWKQTTSITKGQINPTSGTPSPSPEPSDLPEGDGGGEVLGAQTATETPSPSLEPTPLAQSTSGTTVVAFLCIGIGVLTLTGLGGYLAWDPYLKKYVNRLLKRN